MKISKVEKILQSKVGPENRKRAQRIKEGCNEKYNQPVTIANVLNLNWQVKNKIFKGCNNNCTFNPETVEAHSYKHWCFVKVIKGKVVFNDYKYSNTTTRHQWEVRSLLNSLGIKIDLEIDMPESLIHFQTCALPAMYKKLAQYEIILNRKGVRAETKQRAFDSIRKVNFDIDKAKKLGAKCSKSDIAMIYEKARVNEANRLATLDAERAERAIQAKVCKHLEATAQIIDLNQFAA